MECTGFGLNLVSGNYEFAGLVVIDDEEFWHQYGGVIEGNWESGDLRSGPRPAGRLCLASSRSSPRT